MARLSQGGRTLAPQTRGTPTPEPLRTRPLRAAQLAPSLPGSGRRACAARAARFPPRPAVRLAATSPTRCHARFCFLEALNRTGTAFMSFSCSRRDSLRESPVRPTLGLTPLTSLLLSATSPAPEVKKSESFAVRPWSAARKFPTFRPSVGGNVGGGEMGGRFGPLEPQRAAAFLLDLVYFPNLLERNTS